MTRSTHTQKPKQSASTLTNSRKTATATFKSVVFVLFHETIMLEFITATVSQHPGPYRCFVTFIMSTEADSTHLPMDTHDYMQAHNKKNEVTIWTSL